MGDMSAEPSMEEILSSIKRIIAEEGEGAAPRARRPQRAPLSAVPSYDAPPRDDADEVLELREPMPAPDPVAAPEPAPRATAPIVSQQTAAASRGSLDALTRLVVKPDATTGTDNTLESLVREMLRPMLREWLDAKLPEMVEAMVAREIERITGAPKS